MKKLFIAIIIILLILLITSLQNPDNLLFQFLFWKFSISATLLLIIAIILGIITGILILYPAISKRNRTISELNEILDDFREKYKIMIEDKLIKENNENTEK